MATADPGFLCRNIKEVAEEIHPTPAWLPKHEAAARELLQQAKDKVQTTLGEQMPEIMNGSRDAANESMVPVHMLQDAQKEIEMMRNRLLIADSRVAELTKAETLLREERKKLEVTMEQQQQQIKKISDREIEARVRAEVYEELAEKVFNKMIEGMH